MKTSSDNIYACGDISDKGDTLRTTAIDQGKVAANAMFSNGQQWLISDSKLIVVNTTIEFGVLDSGKNIDNAEIHHFSKVFTPSRSYKLKIWSEKNQVLKIVCVVSFVGEMLAGFQAGIENGSLPKEFFTENIDFAAKKQFFFVNFDLLIDIYATAK
jgi:pyruvate/2-oxoglutarate dehydrogenase complex dihydrolipoamide dehydrogenase (E3) component